MCECVATRYFLGHHQPSHSTITESLLGALSGRFESGSIGLFPVDFVHAWVRIIEHLRREGNNHNHGPSNRIHHDDNFYSYLDCESLDH